jgi:acetolactate synthase-1/2/3 large subunit
MNKPVILIGAGCPQSLADKLCTLGIPVLTTWQAIDRVPEDSPVFCGRPGVVGQRAANIIQQKSTVLYIFGARMDNEQVAHRMSNFAPNAKKVVYDIDKAELDKLPVDWTVINADLNDLNIPPVESSFDWLKWCKDLYNDYRYELDGTGNVEGYVDPYYFTRILSDVCEEGEVIVPASSGMQSCAMMQAFKVKRDQKILLCNTTGAMGLEPMAIGAALATKKRVVCVCGDGGFFINMQELELVKRRGLNIKYFVFCNGGYGSITTMQDARFNLRVGGDEQSGFTLPNLEKTARLFNIDYQEIMSNKDVSIIEKIVNSNRSFIVRVNTTLAFRYATKVNSALQDGAFVVDSMEDMTPKIQNLKELMAA